MFCVDIADVGGEVFTCNPCRRARGGRQRHDRHRTAGETGGALEGDRRGKCEWSLSLV